MIYYSHGNLYPQVINTGIVDVDDAIVYPDPDVDDAIVYPEPDPDSGIIYPDLYTDD